MSSWFLFQRRNIIRGLCCLVFWLRCEAYFTRRENNLFKGDVNRPTQSTKKHWDTGSLFTVGSCWGKMIYILWVLLPILLTDWMTEPSVCVCECVNGPSRVGICIKVMAMEIAGRINEQTEWESQKLSPLCAVIRFPREKLRSCST